MAGRPPATLEGMHNGRGISHLIVEGDDRVMMRTVGRVSDLAEDVSQGTAAEDASRHAAATWSLPDFAFKSIIIDKGQAQREVGDTLIVSGADGLVVQVKSRVDATDREEREANWVTKNATKGIRQASGSIRYLATNTIRATNERKDELEIDGPGTRWLSLVILDHPDVPEVEIDAPGAKELPRVVISRRDWEFLFDQLRSTHAVIQYLWRVAEDPDRINRESERYYDLALEDEATASTPMDTDVYGEGVQWSAGLLPLAPAEGEEADHELMFRAVMESIGKAEGLTAEQRLVVLSELDQVQTGYRAELGARLLENLEAVQQVAPPKCLRLTRVLRGRVPAPHMVFSAATYLDERTTGGFEALLTVRHHDLSASLGHPDELSTVGVMLTPRADGQSGWETTAIRVQGRFDETYVEQLRTVANIRPPGVAQDGVTPPSPASIPGAPSSQRRKVGRNDLCPCGSGFKHKRCCGGG